MKKEIKDIVLYAYDVGFKAGSGGDISPMLTEHQIKILVGSCQMYTDLNKIVRKKK